MSHELTGHGVEHVVLERDHVAQRWRDRWDSFCLVTPNWTVQLPGGVYDGPDPDGFLPRDDIVAHLEAYAAGMPVREGTDVVALRRRADDFVLETSSAELSARRVVLATGAYQRPYRPEAMDSLPPDLPQLDVDGYRREADLPPGRVLIVGSGQSGCQLHEAGREVVLACGRAPWVPRRIDGRDVVWWAVESGFMDQRPETLPDAGARLWSNPPDLRTRRRSRSAPAHAASAGRHPGGQVHRHRRRHRALRRGPRRPGLYFVGVHFLRTRESSLLMGVGEDAQVIARAIAGG